MTKNRYTPLPSKLRFLRKIKRMTVQKLTERLDIPVGTYNSIESGYALPSKELLEKLCTALKCKDKDIYDDTLLALIDSWYLANMVSERFSKENEDDTSAIKTVSGSSD